MTSANEPRRARWAWLFVVAAAMPASRVGAEPPQTYPGLACYQRALDVGLSNWYATVLCVGAASDAPAQCFATARDQLGITDLDAVRLCKGATDGGPAACVRDIEARSGLTQTAAVSYCALHGLAPVAPPGPSSASCLARAVRDTSLTESVATRLCYGARSAQPAHCFAWGQLHLLLDQQTLVTLCADYVWVSVGLVPFR